MNQIGHFKVWWGGGGVICPGGYMSWGVYVLGGKCPGGKCPGVNDRGVCVLGVSVRGVHVRGGSVLSPYIICQN